jgi:DNA-directed RNA polymerase subunit E'/Rpb7
MHQLIRTICLDPSLLDHNITSHILAKARSAWEGKCTKDDGFIKRIVSIERIVDNYVSPATSGIMFDLLLNVETLKPAVGDLFIERVQKIIPQGIFTDKAIVAVIPAQTLQGYVFDKDREVFCKDGREISVGDEIEIEITAIKYEKNNFKYIGCLKE